MMFGEMVPIGGRGMQNENLRNNLRHLCSLETSIAQTARKIGINRQQLNKYLNGSTIPSIGTIQRICNFFSVDEAELFIPPNEFKELFKLRDSAAQLPKHLLDMLTSLQNTSKPSDPSFDDVDGKYAVYQIMGSTTPKISKSIIQIKRGENIIFTYRLAFDADAHSERKSVSALRRHGIIYRIENKFYHVETSSGSGASLSILDRSLFQKKLHFFGRSIFLDWGFEQQTCCSNILWEKVGEGSIALSDAKFCGFYSFCDVTLNQRVVELLQGNSLSRAS
ncbi:helix-turn-helix transcriptional regulator [uncultured Tateyamaria sp.]|uniref:helix-turn-helix domain-containing protein n=1 Tax=uncultured Tateyamaria sp. TaxID=455651 RepID=UPI002619EF91|nr:helix-turn-helix transcriptional regulator [uncultured Tateyamaria sp.]